MTENQATIAAAGEILAILGRRRITQTALSAGTGIDIHKLRRRLDGEVRFAVDELDQIAAFLAVPVSTLLRSGAA